MPCISGVKAPDIQGTAAWFLVSPNGRFMGCWKVHGFLRVGSVTSELQGQQSNRQRIATSVNIPGYSGTCDNICVFFNWSLRYGSSGL